MAYYQPQLDRQYQNARRKSVLGLNRTGNLSSSAGAGKLGDLTRAYNDNRTLLANNALRSEEHTSELQSLMRISYAVLCLKKKQKREHSLIPATTNLTNINTHK